MNNYFTYFSFSCNWVFSSDTSGAYTLANYDRRCCIWNDFRCFHRKCHLCELVFLALDTDRASQALCQNFGVGEADTDAGTHIVVVVLNSVNNLVPENREKRLLSFFADSLTCVTNCGSQELSLCVVVLGHYDTPFVNIELHGVLHDVEHALLVELPFEVDILTNGLVLPDFKFEVSLLHDDSERGGHLLNFLLEVTDRSFNIIKVVRVGFDLQLTQLRLGSELEDLGRTPNDLSLVLLLARCDKSFAVETHEMVLGKVEDCVERSQLLVGHRLDQQLDILVLGLQLLVLQNMAHVADDHQLAADTVEGPRLDLNLESLLHVDLFL